MRYIELREMVYLNAAESPEVFSLGDECRLFKDDK
jgi:hypothetical protein